MKAEIKDKGFVISYVLFRFVISYTVSVLGNFPSNFQGVFFFFLIVFIFINIFLYFYIIFSNSIFSI